MPPSPPSDRPSANSPQEPTPPSLGLRNPLLPPAPLGQRHKSSAAFRLGSRSLAVLAPLHTSNRLADWGDSPAVLQPLSTRAFSPAPDSDSPDRSPQPSPNPSNEQGSTSLTQARSNVSAPTQHSERDATPVARIDTPPPATTQPGREIPASSSPPSLQTQSQGSNTVPNTSISEVQSPARSDATVQASNETSHKVSTSQADWSADQPPLAPTAAERDRPVQPQSPSPSASPIQPHPSSGVPQSKSNPAASHREPTVRPSPNSQQPSSQQPSSQQPTTAQGQSFPITTISGHSVQRASEPAAQSSSDRASVPETQNDGGTVRNAEDRSPKGEGHSDDRAPSPAPIQAKSDSSSQVNVSHSSLTSGQTTEVPNAGSSTKPAGSSESRHDSLSGDRSQSDQPFPTIQPRQTSSTSPQPTSSASRQSTGRPTPSSTPAPKASPSSGHPSTQPTPPQAAASSAPALQQSPSGQTSSKQSVNPSAESTSTPAPHTSPRGETPSKPSVEPPEDSKSTVQTVGTPSVDNSSGPLHPSESISPARIDSDASSDRPTSTVKKSSGDRSEGSLGDIPSVQRQSSDLHAAPPVPGNPSSETNGARQNVSADPPVVPPQTEPSHTSTSNSPSSTPIHPTAPSIQAAGIANPPSSRARPAQPNPSESSIGSNEPTPTTQPIASHAANLSKRIVRPDASDVRDFDERSFQPQSQSSSTSQGESHSKQQAIAPGVESKSTASAPGGHTPNPAIVQRNPDSTAVPPLEANITTEAGQPPQTNNNLHHQSEISEPKHSQVSATSKQESIIARSPSASDRSELPDVQRSPSTPKKQAVLSEPPSTATNPPDHSSDSPKSSTQTSPFPPIPSNVVARTDSNAQTVAPAKSTPGSSNSSITVRRSPSSQSSSTSAAPQLPASPATSSSDQQVSRVNPQESSTAPSSSGSSTPEIQPSASPLSEGQAGDRSASSSPSEKAAPASFEQTGESSVESARTSSPLSTSTNLAPNSSPQVPPQHLKAGKAVQSNSPAAAVHSSETTTDSQVSHSVAQRATDSTARTRDKLAAFSPQDRAGETTDSTSLQSLETESPKQPSVPTPEGDSARSSIAPNSEHNPSLIQRIPSLMTTAFNALGTIISSSLSEPSATAEPTSASPTPSPAEEIRRSPEAPTDQSFIPPSEKSSTDISTSISAQTSPSGSASQSATASQAPSTGQSSAIEASPKIGLAEPTAPATDARPPVPTSPVPSVSPPEISRTQSLSSAPSQRSEKLPTQPSETIESDGDVGPILAVGMPPVPTNVATPAVKPSLTQDDSPVLLTDSDRDRPEPKSSAENFSTVADSDSTNGPSVQGNFLPLSPIQPSTVDPGAKPVSPEASISTSTKQSAFQTQSHADSGQPEGSRSGSLTEANERLAAATESQDSATTIQAAPQSAIESFSSLSKSKVSDVNATNLQSQQTKEIDVDRNHSAPHSPPLLSPNPSAIQTKSNDDSQSRSNSLPVAQRSLESPTDSSSPNRAIYSQTSASESPTEQTNSTEASSNGASALERQEHPEQPTVHSSIQRSSPVLPSHDRQLEHDSQQHDPSETAAAARGDRPVDGQQAGVETFPSRSQSIQRQSNRSIAQPSPATLQPPNSARNEGHTPAAPQSSPSHAAAALPDSDAHTNNESLPLNTDLLSAPAERSAQSTIHQQRTIEPQSTSEPLEVQADSISAPRMHQSDVHADSEPIQPKNSSKETLAPPVQGDRDRDSHVQESTGWQASSTKVPTPSPGRDEQRHTVLRKELQASSADPGVNITPSPPGASQSQSPITPQTASANRAISVPEDSNATPIQQQAADRAFSALRKIESSERSRLSQPEGTVAPTPIQQQPSRSPSASSSINSSSNPITPPKLASTTQQPSGHSLAPPSTTDGVTNSGLNSNLRPSSQPSPLDTDTSHSTATQSAPPQETGSSAIIDRNLPEGSNSSDRSHPHLADGVVTPDASTIHQSFPQPDSASVSPINHQTDVEAEQQQLHPLPAQPSQTNNLAIQRHSIHPTRPSSSDVAAAHSEESHEQHDDEPQSSFPLLPRALKPIAALKPLIQPYLSPSPTSPSESSSQEQSADDDRRSDNSEPLTSDSAPVSSDSTNRAPSNTDSPSPSHPLHESPKQELPLPEQWSGIADLLSESSVSISPPQPPTTRHTSPSPSIQANFDREASASSTIQPQWDESLSADSSETIDPEQLNAYLDTLAREVYNMLRLRLERDRERNGNSYSGRLPW